MINRLFDENFNINKIDKTLKVINYNITDINIEIDYENNVRQDFLYVDFSIEYNEYLNKPIVSFGYFVSFRGLDKGIIEILGPYGVVSTFTPLMKKISKFQTGYIYHYAFIMLIGIVILLTTISFWSTLQRFHRCF